MIAVWQLLEPEGSSIIGIIQNCIKGIMDQWGRYVLWLVATVDSLLYLLTELINKVCVCVCVSCLLHSVYITHFTGPFMSQFAPAKSICVFYNCSCGRRDHRRICKLLACACCLICMDKIWHFILHVLKTRLLFFETGMFLLVKKKNSNFTKKYCV